MNFRFTKSRALLSRVYNPRGPYRNSSRYWDYALYPFWNEMNVGIAQGAVQSFVRNSENSDPFSSCNPNVHDNATRTLTLTAPSFSPTPSTVNVHWVETPTAHIFRADVPGLRREDLSILVEGSTLQISGQRNLDCIPTNVNERIQWEVSFVRRFRLPTTAVMERISAMLDHGVLTLTIPKLQIPPSVSWFVPINGCPSQVTIRNWNPTWTQQEQTQPDSHGPDCQGSNSTMLQLGKSRIIESRPHECNLPSSVSVQSVSLKGRDENVTSNSDVNVPTDPKLASKTLSITQEEGTGPNAKVTLNININAGKVSAEGESSSLQITSTSQTEDQKLLHDGNFRPSLRSHSLSPRSTLKPRSSLAQTQDYEDEEIDPPPSTSRRKSSVQIEDDQEIYPSPLASPSSSRRKSSVQIEDDQEIDPSPPTSPSSSRRKSSFQRLEDNEDVNFDPHPSSKHQSLLQAEDLKDTDFSPRPSTSKRKSSIKIDDQGDEDPSSSIKRGSEVENMDNLKRLSLGRPKTARQSSVLANEEEASALNKRRRSKKGGSQVVERQPSIVANDEEDDESEEEDSRINERRRSSKRDSQFEERQPSFVADDEEEDTSNMEGLKINKRQRPNSQQRRESKKEYSPGRGRRKSSLAEQGSVATAENNEFEFGRKPSTERGRRDSKKNFSRKRESSLGLGADLTGSRRGSKSSFEDVEDEEDI